MIDFGEIISAWITKFNPNETQKQLADERLTICNNCVYYTEVFENRTWSAICGKCNCPLTSKIFTPKTTSCPIGKWVEIDKKFGIYKEEKTNKTIL